ncbi:BH0178 [Halalkalibacterium halodurans C-125]|uniref:BH0178 protein n=1 Tax=Halalkalibacterium halodurans (strain ATCC BAA-125 / DSM 18197 / FERM 7344 / JCM 9153 / C-125) TaxID=272558 RepID=Q9KGC6_HALH5|nr:hypothetical protein [Halalkalibacterium halodurans]BAB03897.1 BH0178 [Halalkalibacterium halodurans C-125]
MLARVIRYHLLSMLTPIKILLLVFVFMVNTLLVFSIYGDLIPEDSIKATVFMFYVPINIRMDLFRWILVLLPILLIMGAFLSRELKERSLYLLLQMKSFRLWFHSFMIVTFLFVLLFFTVGFVITYGMILIFPRNAWIDESLFPYFYSVNEWVLVTHQFSLLVLSVFMLVLLKIFFVFLIDNVAVASLMTLICLTASMSIGRVYPSVLDKLPLTYGLFAYRELHAYPFIWSYSILFAGIIALYFLIFCLYRTRRETLFGIR